MLLVHLETKVKHQLKINKSLDRSNPTSIRYSFLTFWYLPHFPCAPLFLRPSFRCPRSSSSSISNHFAGAGGVSNPVDSSSPHRCPSVLNHRKLLPFLCDECWLKGYLATPFWKFSFWRITHFKAAIPRIGRRRFVNIIINYVNIKNDPHNYHLSTREYKTDWNMKKRAFHIFCGHEVIVM